MNDPFGGAPQSSRRQSPKRKKKKKKSAAVEISTGQTPELDKEELKVMLLAEKEKVQRLTTENERLIKEKLDFAEQLSLDKDEKDVLLQHYSTERKKAEQELKKVRLDLLALEDARRKLREELSNKIEDEKSEKFRITRKLQDQINSLQDIIDATEEFRRDKANITAEVASLKKALTDLQKEYADQMKAQTELRECDRESLRNDMAKKLRKTQAKLFKLTDDHLTITTQQTIKDNERLTREVELYAKETKELTQTNQELKQRNLQLKHSYELQCSNVEELIKKSQAQQFTINKLLAKIKQLEDVVEETKVAASDERSQKVAALTETVDKQHDIIIDQKQELDRLREANSRLEAQRKSAMKAVVEKSFASTTSNSSDGRIAFVPIPPTLYHRQENDDQLPQLLTPRTMSSG